jgi:hypothetical protein
MHLSFFTTSVVPNILISVPTKKVKQPLSVTHPELAKEADGWDPNSFTRGSHKRVKWKCKSGHSWEAAVKTRALGGNNCPVCSGHVVVVGFNDLKSKYPEIAKQAFEWDPSTVTHMSGKKVFWKCEKGHITEKRIADRVSGVGCPVCSGHQVLAGFNDLATTHPELTKEADGWSPTTITKGHDKKLSWKCEKGHQWKANVYSRAGKMKVGCPFCAEKRVLSGFNDIQTRFPEVAKEADGWDPTTVHPGSNRVRNWRCGLGHLWKTSPDQRIRIGTNCLVCSNHVLLIGFNDLSTTHPELSMEAVGWNPNSIMSGSEKKFRWKCSRDHIWSASVYSRSMGRGCPSCAQTGFDPNADGYLYFLSHRDWEMFQIGITNFPDDRLNRHRRLGWELLELRGPMDGHLTQQWETAILRMLKAKGADLSNEKIAGKFDGYSEAWSKSTFEVSSIKELMRLTEKYEEK